MALQPIRIFDGSFTGATLYENPAYVSPNAVRRMVKQRAAGKYNAKVRRFWGGGGAARRFFGVGVAGGGVGWGAGGSARRVSTTARCGGWRGGGVRRGSWRGWGGGWRGGARRRQVQRQGVAPGKGSLPSGPSSLLRGRCASFPAARRAS
jgi:hypothetical protein